MFFDHLIEYAESSGNTSRHMWILKTVLDEALAEMADEPEDRLEEWFAQAGQIVTWIGTGQAEDLPEPVLELLKVQGNKIALDAPVPPAVAIGAATQ